MPQPKTQECKHQYEDMIVQGHSNTGLQTLMVNGRPYVSYVDDAEVETRCVKCGRLYEPEQVTDLWVPDLEDLCRQPNQESVK